MEPSEQPNLRQRILEQFQTLRESARLQAHLLNMDARESWSQIERRLEEMQQRLAAEPERLSENAQQAVRELSEQAKEYLRNQSLRRLELRKPVSELMTTRPVTCSIHDDLNQVAQLMWDLRVGWLPVLDAEGRLAGVITDRDLTMAAYTRGCRLIDATAQSAMAPHVYACAPTDTVGSALSTMVDRRVRRLPVVDAERRVIGVLCVSDIAHYVRSLTGGLYLASPELSAVLCRDRDERPEN